MNDLFLVFTGMIAGVIDSIAGGGGLITLPAFASLLEPGPHAIGTNKIVGTAGALMAFLVYLRKQPLHLKKGLSFILAVGAGSLLGSLASPLVPKLYFRFLLIGACPLVLFVVWNKQVFLEGAKEQAGKGLRVLGIAGILVGFYDGFFGPGGGTFMLIALLWGVRLSLFEALLLSKLANALSAAVSLASYGFQGYVHVRPGVTMALGMLAGSFMGARLATRKAEGAVRPVLVLVVLLLMAVQIREVFNSH
jgi:uncharacterized membrane protein YfcA